MWAVKYILLNYNFLIQFSEEILSDKTVVWNKLQKTGPRLQSGRNVITKRNLETRW